MRRKKQLPLLESCEIIDIAAEGKAIAKFEERIVFVSKAIPGDVVDVQIRRKKKNFWEGEAIKFHKHSKEKINPKCEYFGICGGCKWQQLSYEKQLFYKQKQVVDNLARIGKLNLPEISPILASENEYFYRNKLEFTFSNRRWLTSEEIGNDGQLDMRGLGFHIPKLFDKVIDIDTCWLQSDVSNKIKNSIRDFSKNNELNFFDIRNQHGLLRNLIIRTSTTEELMVILSFFRNEEDKIEALLNHLSVSFPDITSLFYVINSKANDSITDQKMILYKGKDHIMEKMEDLNFKIGPKSFFQTNTIQATKLYQKVREFAGLSGTELIYDLYTGTGTIANFLAGHASKVVGIEYVPEAIEDAKINSEINGIENTVFYAGDMKDVLNESFVSENGKPNVIVLDPPRAGMHPKIPYRIVEINPEKIVYVSCNPATQARDLKELDPYFRITKIQPVDMFPQTHHVENIVLLENRKRITD